MIRLSLDRCRSRQVAAVLFGWKIGYVIDSAVMTRFAVRSSVIRMRLVCMSVFAGMRMLPVPRHIRLPMRSSLSIWLMYMRWACSLSLACKTNPLNSVDLNAICFCFSLCRSSTGPDL